MRFLERLHGLAITDTLARIALPARRRRSQGVRRGLGDRGGVGKEPHTLYGAELHALVSRLPADLRIAFVLHDMEGLSEGAIGRHLRVEEEDARRLVRDARLEIIRLRREEVEDRD